MLNKNNTNMVRYSAEDLLAVLLQRSDRLSVNGLDEGAFLSGLKSKIEEDGYDLEGVDLVYEGGTIFQARAEMMVCLGLDRDSVNSVLALWRNAVAEELDGFHNPKAGERLVIRFDRHAAVRTRQEDREAFLEKVSANFEESFERSIGVLEVEVAPEKVEGCRVSHPSGQKYFADGEIYMEPSK